MPAAPVTIKLDLAVLSPEQLEQLARHAALLAAGMIQRRTDKGQGLDGPFKPYSPGYAKLRKAAGRSTKRNLTLSGAMLGSLSVLESGAGWAVLGFQGSAPATRFKKSNRWVTKQVGGMTRRRNLTRSISKSSATVPNALKAVANHRITPFFGLTPEEQAELSREVGTLASKLLREKQRPR